MMNTLQDIVHRIYGKRLIQRATQGHAHFLFTTFDDEITQETYFLKVVELPTYLYISQANTELIRQKYGQLVPVFQITPIDRNFQAYTYLVRSPINILPLGAFLQIKKDCGEPLDIDFFLRFLEFAKNSFKILEKHALPLLSLQQIGITEKGEFLLSDPACYFSGHQKMTIKQDFGSWIYGFVRDVLNLPMDVEEQQTLLKEYFGEYLNAIRPFFEYLMSGQATLEETEQKLARTISRISDDDSTITGSFVDVNQMIERSLKGSIHEQKVKFNKMGKLAKFIIFLVVVALVTGVGFFSFQFFNRSVQCMEGEFLSDKNLCISCSSGCLRCQNSQPDRCTKCNLNMYLVIANQQDKQGFCLNQCKGRLIGVDVCVRDQLSVRSSLKIYNLSLE